jgi:hypothetical protein
MSLGCKCDLGLSNTGTPNCITIQSVTSKLILVPLFNNDGGYNSISLSGTTGINVNDKINEEDASKRWFPLGTFENVTMEKAESSFEEAPSGKKVFIKQGKRSFAGELWSTTPTLLGKIQDNRCVEFGVYIVDVNGNLIGLNQNQGNLRPIPVDNQSFDARLMFATDTTIQKIMVAFDFDRLVDESQLWMITPEDASNFNFNSVEGLLDVRLYTENVSINGFSVLAQLDYGTGGNRIKVKGLRFESGHADFSVKADGIPVTASEVDFLATNNLYSFVFDTPKTLATVLTISINKDGYVGSVTDTI